MRIGIVCPYSLDVPGGVQNHIKDLAEALIGRGHSVSVLGPSEAAEGEAAAHGLPPYVVAAGRAIPVPFNGAVARLMFGPVAAMRVRRWLEDGHFDLIHVHEPGIPSLGLIALGAAECPVVGTFHGHHINKSRALSAAAGLLRPRLERLSARIAVSEYARDTHVHHLGGEPVVIPNGLYVEHFRAAEPRDELRGGEATLCFVGRLDEPRKGLPLLLESFGDLAAGRRGLRLLVVGGGDVDGARDQLAPGVRDQVDFLGRIDDAEKARILRSADVYVAPNTGGESFGIVLIEAMAAGCAVVASDLAPFTRVLDGGRLGVQFRNRDADDLTRALTELLASPVRREQLVSDAEGAVDRYDWSRVAVEIEQVYETVVGR